MIEKNCKNDFQAQSETLSLIKKQFFKTKMCPFQKNKKFCLNESNCHYAHSLDELKPMPDLRNTKLCNYVKKKVPCCNVNCKFAHDIDTLKPSVHLATYKSTICSFWDKGKCFNGNKCRFAHGNEDIKTNEDLNTIESKKNKNKQENYDIKQGTSSTQSFNSCDYSLNCSLENTNVSSIYKSSDALILKTNHYKEKVSEQNIKREFILNKDILEEIDEITDIETTENGYTFYDNKNNNSIKNVIDTIENEDLSTFKDPNDKYTKVIQYLLNENNILKKSIRKDQLSVILEKEHDYAGGIENNEDREYREENDDQKLNKASFICSVTGNNKMDSDDLTQYLFSDEYIGNSFFNNKNVNLNNAETFDDPNKIDENFNNIIKTIDDILISKNVDSFSNLKDATDNYENKDISMNSSNEINQEYDNFLCNTKSMETQKNIYNSFNYYNLIDRKSSNKSKEADFLDQIFQENMINNEQEEKKKDYYNANFSMRQSRLFSCDSNQKKQVKTCYNENYMKSAIFPLKDQSIKKAQNMHQRLMQLHKVKNDEMKNNKDVNYWNDDYITVRDDYGIKMNNDNSSFCNNGISGNSSIDNLHLIQKNQTSYTREKNAKLNLREKKTLNEDDNMNLDNILEFSNDKSNILKKIKNLISNELKNHKKNCASKKIGNFTNILNVSNDNLTTKSKLFNDQLYSCNIMSNGTLNNNILNKNTITNNTYSGYDNNNNINGYLNENNTTNNLNKDISMSYNNINNDKNIWDNSVNFNEYAYPILSHGWMNNQKNNDFFYLSNTVNLSNLN